MATEPEAKGSDARPGPLTPAARRRPAVPAEPPPDPAWNLSDELEGLEANAEHVDVYESAPPSPLRAPPRTPLRTPPKPAPRPRPGAPAPPHERSTPGVTAAVVSISLVTLAMLLQLASVLSSRSGSGAAAAGISADASRDVVAPGGRIELAGDGAPDRAELVL
jgi:hypothetical protein